MGKGETGLAVPATAFETMCNRKYDDVEFEEWVQLGLNSFVGGGHPEFTSLDTLVSKTASIEQYRDFFAPDS